MAVDETLLDVGGEAVKGLVDVDVALCRDFEEGDAELISECLSLLFRYDALVFPIAFVANQDFVDTLGSMLLNVLEPSTDV